MSWAQHRRGRHLSIAVPPEIKNQLVRRKALGEGGIGQQIVEALQLRWGNRPPAPPAAVANPAAGDVVASGPYKGMRSQPVTPSPANPVPWRL